MQDIKFSLHGSKDSFYVEKLETRQYRISGHYIFKVTIIASIKLDQSEILNKKGYITFKENNRKTYLNGIIDKLKIIENSETNIYKLRLVSPLLKLSQGHSKRTFINQPITSLIKNILFSAGFYQEEFQIKLCKNYSKYNFCVQFQENDLEFFNRLLSNYGISYAFQQKKDLAILFITDNINSLQSDTCLPLSFLENTDNWEHGIYYFSEKCTQSIALRRDFIAHTSFLNLKPGQFISLKNHFINEYNNVYLITGITLKISEKKLPYAVLSLQKQNPSFQFEIKLAPRFHHLLPAIVEASVDDLGRYYVRFLFDQSHHAYGKASPPLSLLQTSENLHFPLPEKTRVAIGFIKGDLEKPVILGVLDHPNYPTPITSKNTSQYIFQTPQGNTLLWDDGINKENLKFSTGKKYQQLSFHDKSGITLSTQEGNISVYADQQIAFFIDQSHQLRSNQNYRLSTQTHQTITTHKGEISHTSGNDFSMKAYERLSINSSQNLKLESKTFIFAKSEKDLLCETQSGDFSLKTQTGSLNCLSFGKTLIQSIQGHIKIGQTGNQMMLKEGNLNIYARQIILEANTIEMNGIIHIA